MQIRNGKIYVANGATTVYGVGVDWDSVNVGNTFLVVGLNQQYRINAVDTVSDPAELELDTPFTGTTITSGAATNNNYAVHRDFTPNFNLPVLNAGDVETATVVSRSLQIIDQHLGGGANGGEEVTVAHTNHNFIVGNVLRFDSGGTYKLADSLASGTMDIVGVVTEGKLTDVNSFKFKSTGQVSGISTVSVTAGDLIYVKDGPYTVDVEAANTATTTAGSTVQVVVMEGVAASTGIISNLTSGVSSVFGEAADGLVPGTAVGGVDDGKYLKGDGTWGTAGIAPGAIKGDHLYVGTEPADEAAYDALWTNFGDASADDSAYWALKYLRGKQVDVDNFLSTTGGLQKYQYGMMADSSNVVTSLKLPTEEVWHAANGNGGSATEVNLQIPGGVTRLKIYIRGAVTRVTSGGPFMPAYAAELNYTMLANTIDNVTGEAIKIIIGYGGKAPKKLPGLTSVYHDTSEIVTISGVTAVDPDHDFDDLVTVAVSDVELIQGNKIPTAGIPGYANPSQLHGWAGKVVVEYIGPPKI